MTSEIINSALAYWERIRDNRFMPSRADIDPVDIPKLLPFVLLVDVFYEPLDFRFRLIGTAIHLIISRNYCNLRFSQLPHMTAGNLVWAQYEEVVNTRKPLISSVNYIGPDRYVRRLRHCIMPLSDDGKTVNMTFVAVEIDRR